MNFTCHGTIVGWTVAGERVQGRTQYPELQVWRADPSRGLDYYYKPGQDIPVNPEGPACDIVTKTCGQIFQCRLRVANQVSVQPGDVLGVELPQVTVSGFHLHFISIPGTQDHYIYRRQLQSSVHTSSYTLRLSADQLLISLEIKPGEQSNAKLAIILIPFASLVPSHPNLFPLRTLKKIGVTEDEAPPSLQISKLKKFIFLLPIQNLKWQPSHCLLRQNLPSPRTT